MIQFKVDTARVLDAITFVIGEANNDGYRPTQYEIVKSLFLADRAHLNKFGRPITYDQYVAMIHGPVPSYSYDMLKPTFDWHRFGRDRAPWIADKDGNKNLFHLRAGEELSFRRISKSDRDELSAAFKIVRSLTFQQLRKLTHEDKAYLDAWRDDDEAKSYPMDSGLFLEHLDEESLDDLRYLAEMTRG